jgi:flagella basal body P-ring formation protein FlgA
MLPFLRAPHFLLLPWLVTLAGVVTCPDPALAGEPVRIELKKDVVVSGRSVRIGDAGAVFAADRETREAIEAVRIQDAPRVGAADRLSRAEIEQVLRFRLPRAGRNVEWGGANVVTLRAAMQTVDTTAFAATAQRHLIEALGHEFAGVEAELLVPLAAVAAPVGEVVFQPRPVDAAHAGSRQSVWIDVLVDGGFYRAVVVPFQLRLRQRVQVARRDLPAGTLVSEADFDARIEDISDRARRVLPASALQGTMRVAQRIGAGEVLMRHQLVDEATVQRGDMVKLVLAAGGVQVETRGVAQQPALLGQDVKV